MSAVSLLHSKNSARAPCKSYRDRSLIHLFWLAQELMGFHAKEDMTHMPTIKRSLLVFAAVLLVLGAMPALAQEPTVAQGQLVRVDANAKTIAIRTAQGADMLFSYNEQTKVSGAGDSVAGLATMTGTELTIHFTKRQQENVATQIEVAKKPDTQARPDERKP
jgi:hypothetical protein